MRRNRTIQCLVTVWLVVLFAFSITPRIFLHDWLADHTDFYRAPTVEITLSVEPEDCRTDELVVSNPFIRHINFAGLRIVFSEVSRSIFPQYEFLSNSSFSKDSRGPPPIA